MSIDYYNKPTKSLDELLEKYNPGIYLILEDVLSSKRSHRFIYQDLLDILKWGFEIKEIRTMPIKFKIRQTDKIIRELEIRNFLSNLILWYPFVDMDRIEVLDESFIFDFTKFNMKYLIDFINNKILPYHEGEFTSKNKIVDDICYNITAIANAFCLLMGMGISIYDIRQIEKRNPEMTELIHGSIDNTSQPIEIEADLEKRTKRMIELIIHDTEFNDLKPIFLSGKNLSEAQFREIIIKIGLKADINGNTIPMAIDASFLVTGLNKPSYIYINALSGRKALILTKTQMSTPGAFSKKLNLLATSPGILRKDYEKCDSADFITYKINDDLFLKLLHGRYYYDKYGEMKQLDYLNDKDLIGKMIPFRSPCTCNSHDGICKFCYGHLFDINFDMFSVGSLAATKTSNPFGQSVLSSKHSQKTTSDLITFNSEFDEIFELSSNEIILKDEANNDEDLYVLLDNVQIEESDDQESYFVDSFKVVDEKGQSVYNISEQNNSNFFLSEQLLVLYKKLKDKSKPISLDEFDSDSVLFTVEIKNKELTAPFKIVQKLLNSNDRLGATTLSEVCQLFAENLIKMGINNDLVHAETIIRGLLRKKSNELEFPDWGRNSDHNDYQIMRLNAALFKNPSPLIALSYGDLRRQLISPELYQRNAPSHIDSLFVPQLSKYIDQ